MDATTVHILSIYIYMNNDFIISKIWENYVEPEQKEEEEDVIQEAPKEVKSRKKNVIYTWLH